MWRDICASETSLSRLLDLLPLYFDLVVDYFLVLLECLLYFVVGNAPTLHLQFQFYTNSSAHLKLLTLFQCVDLLDEHPPDRLLAFVHIIVADRLLYRFLQDLIFLRTSIGDLLRQLFKVVLQLANFLQFLDVEVHLLLVFAFESRSKSSISQLE